MLTFVIIPVLYFLMYEIDNLEIYGSTLFLKNKEEKCSDTGINK